MNRTYSLAKSSDELKKLIFENPDLPIVVLAGEEASGYDFYWTYCSNVSYCISEILDCDYYDYDSVFVDRDRLEEKIADDIYDENEEASDEYCEELIKCKLEELEPYWKKVITIYATN